LKDENDPAKKKTLIEIPKKMQCALRRSSIVTGLLEFQSISSSHHTSTRSGFIKVVELML
jgi:hypothetical protein